MDLELLYECDAYNDDLPYWQPIPNRPPLLIIPYTLDTNDMKFAVPPGFGDPEGFYNYLKILSTHSMKKEKRDSPK